MTRPISTRAIRTSVIIALAAAGCGRSVTTTTTTTTPPAQRDPRMATVFVDVAPMLTHINRYRVGPKHTYLRPARETGQLVSVQIGALGTSIDIDPLSGPQGFRVIGMVENKDPRYTELVYGLKPATRYLVWVTAGPRNSTSNSRTRWGLLEYPRTQTGVFPSQPVGYVLWCQNYDHPAGRTSDVDFRDPTTCNVNVSADAQPLFRFATWNGAAEDEDAATTDDGSRSAQGNARGVVWFQCATGGCIGSTRF